MWVKHFFSYFHSLDGNQTSAYDEMFVPNIIFGEISFSCRLCAWIVSVFFFLQHSSSHPIKLSVMENSFSGDHLKRKSSLIGFLIPCEVFVELFFFLPSNNKAISRQPREQRTHDAPTKHVSKNSIGPGRFPLWTISVTHSVWRVSVIDEQLRSIRISIALYTTYTHKSYLSIFRCIRTRRLKTAKKKKTPRRKKSS